MTMTIEHLLTVSNAFEGRKKMLTEALAYIKASQKAYAEFIQLSKIAYEESEKLDSPLCYRLYPLVTAVSQQDYERKAAEAKQKSEELFKKGNELMFQFLIEQTYNKLF